MVRLLADRHFTPLADAMMADKDQRLWLLPHTARQFGANPLDPHGVGVISVLPQFFGDGVSPDTLPAIRSWTAALFGELDRQDKRITGGELRASRCLSPCCSALRTATSTSSWVTTSQDCSPLRNCTAWRTHPRASMGLAREGSPADQCRDRRLS